MKIKLPTIEHVRVVDEIKWFLESKVTEMKKDGIVIGVSGGVDSAVCAVLSKMAMDDMGKTMTGLILPGSFSDDCIKDNTDAITLCNKFNIPYIQRTLEELIVETKLLITHNTGLEINKVELGNMSSRIRANFIHTVAGIKNALVCGTGNRDEDYGVGYYTLFGDGAVHMSPIGKLSKRLVYEMASHLGVPEEIRRKTPSARLEDGQTDAGDLGYGYNAVEIVTEGMDQGYDIDAIVQELASYPLTKFASVKDMVIDIINRHRHIASQKSRLVSPDIANVSLNYN